MRRSELLKLMWSKISFLRMARPQMMEGSRLNSPHRATRRSLANSLSRRPAAQTTPRQAGDRSRGPGHFVVRQGELVEGRGAAQGSVATGKMDMSDALVMHNRLLKRQYFGAAHVRRRPLPHAPLLVRQGLTGGGPCTRQADPLRQEPRRRSDNRPYLSTHHHPCISSVYHL